MSDARGVQQEPDTSERDEAAFKMAFSMLSKDEKQEFIRCVSATAKQKEMK